MQAFLLWFTPLFPLLCGMLCWFLPCIQGKKTRNAFVFLALCVNMALSVWLSLTGDGQLYLFSITGTIPIYFQSDLLGRLFLLLVGAMWLNSGAFSFDYLGDDPAQRRYYTFYLLTLGALNGICLAGTLVTMYVCFEMMTLLSVALVLHNMTKEAVAAGIKYLVYSVAGAMMGLFGIFFFTQNAVTPVFTPGGVLSPEAVSSQGAMLLWVLLVTIIGFGTKAGMFPMHGWLPTAHPIAPACASAVLSGVITKMGVLCIIRVIYFVVGPEFLRGTWVQTVLLILALCTVFMGSMMAFKVTGLKKRLAYSTVSQVSYILFGVFMLNQTAFVGSMLHLYFHSIMKNALFLCAGAVIVKTGLHDVRELKGVGKRMPVTMWCFTLAGIGLVGIPPLSGFMSKWQLATGAIGSGVAVFSWLGPVVLLVSALLTAAYLLPVSIDGFFPGHNAGEAAIDLSPCEASWGMTIPLLILTALTIVLGLCPSIVQNAAEALAALLL
ncbi:MAG: proton-conducting transporter membrane subunit [Eubacteriales bacterium]|nr:proton-conducting transporter membrane subunit [Eubacteriales bacterium]